MKVEDQEASANETMQKGRAAMDVTTLNSPCLHHEWRLQVAQTANEKEAAQAVIDDAQKHLDEVSLRPPSAALMPRTDLDQRSALADYIPLQTGTR